MQNSIEYGREAIDFIERIDGLSKIPEVMNAVELAFNRFGFETIIVTGLPNPDQEFAQMVMAKRWPAEWFDIYTKNNFDRADPVVRLCRRTVNPFEWSEAPYDAEREPRAAEVMRRAADFRMARGFIVPIHGHSGFDSAVSLGGVDLDLNPRSKPAIHLMAMYAFDRVRRLLKPGHDEPCKLTPREKEVLAWASRGKSAWEVGEIINITQRTVEQHLENARRKLGAMNGTHAVALAIRNRSIDPS